MMYERIDCRLCGGRVETVLKLADTPLANLFPDKPYVGEKYPLELKQCVGCGHVQVGHVVDDSVLFNADYKYETPEGLKPQLQHRAKQLKEKYPSARIALEIGANNGLFMHALRDAGFESVMGVDPSSSEWLIWKMPFDPQCAELILRRVGMVDLIVANNVFAHIDDLRSVFDAIKDVLSPDGSLVFEVQYRVSMMGSGAFDMIYHEHRDYHALGPLALFLQSCGLVMTEYEIFDAHGGSIRVTAKKHGMQVALPHEPCDWDAFRDHIDATKQAMQFDRQLAAFGAPAKATTLIYQLGLQGKIKHCVDDTPHKQGKYIAGTDIKVLGRHGMEAEMLLLAWNYEDLICKMFPATDFIVPFKEVA